MSRLLAPALLAIFASIATSAPNRQAPDVVEQVVDDRPFPQFPSANDCEIRWLKAREIGFETWESLGDECSFWHAAYCWEAAWYIQQGVEQDFYVARLKSLIGDHAFRHGYLPMPPGGSP